MFETLFWLMLLWNVPTSESPETPPPPPDTTPVYEGAIIEANQNY